MKNTLMTIHKTNHIHLVQEIIGLLPYLVHQQIF